MFVVGEAGILVLHKHTFFEIALSLNQYSNK